MRTDRIPFAVLIFAFLFVTSCKDDETPTMNLPSGCQSQGVYAIEVLETDYRCLPTNFYTDAQEALGPPDASSAGPGRTQLQGMTSLGVDGSIVLFMGSCIEDLPGPDLRVWQVVSHETVEVQVSASDNGPFVSLGSIDCGEGTALFSNKCDFDLAGSGLNNVRVVKIVDRETIAFPTARCDNAGVSPGADLDAVEVLHPSN